MGGWFRAWLLTGSKPFMKASREKEAKQQCQQIMPNNNFKPELEQEVNISQALPLSTVKKLPHFSRQVASCKLPARVSQAELAQTDPNLNRHHYLLAPLSYIHDGTFSQLMEMSKPSGNCKRPNHFGSSILLGK